MPSSAVPSMVNAQPPSASHAEDFTWLIVIACVLSGTILGLGLGCYNQGNRQNSPFSLTTDGEGEDTNLLGGIQLKTLAGGGGVDSIDFRACVERAMLARHLPSAESLLIVNPKEVVLSKIIGEGSFGRVWSGHWRNNAGGWNLALY